MTEARHITEATIDRVYLGLQGSMDTREFIEMVIECHNEVLVAAGIDLVPHTSPQAPAVHPATTTDERAVEALRLALIEKAKTAGLLCIEEIDEVFAALAQGESR
jgi:hypothetical protein